jgi:hypothetical protein
VTFAFDHQVRLDPAGDLEAFLKQVPAKWVVYLMTDADDRPVQLLCVKNLRASLKRRLGGNEQIGPSKRVDYRDLIRHVHYTRVDSAFEADWTYYEAARVAFPNSYQGMVGFRPAWFVHVNPDANFPRYTKTIDLTFKAGTFIGPIEDKHAAARLMELAEDAFDLCRYWNILVQAPNANACAYKQMHKCPAPCDGSISMDHYRFMVEWSARTIVDPKPMIDEQTRRMQQAAQELKFEAAAKIKQFVAQLSQLGKGPFRHVARLEGFRFVTLQHGPRDGQAKAFVITPGMIEPVLGLIGPQDKPADVLRHVLRTAERAPVPIDQPATERIGIVAAHLFTAKAVHGAFLRLGDVDERSFAKAYKDLLKQKRPDADENEDEGVMKELQAI